MSRIKTCDIVYDKVLSVEGSVARICQNYWDMLMQIDIMEEELKQMGVYFTDQEKQYDEFYILYTENGEDLSCESRIKKIYRPNLRKMLS